MKRVPYLLDIVETVQPIDHLDRGKGAGMRGDMGDMGRGTRDDGARDTRVVVSASGAAPLTSERHAQRERASGRERVEA